MQTAMTAIETTGTVDEQHQLRLDADLPLTSPLRVKVIVLYPVMDEMTEANWLKAAARNPAFAYLRESAEDLYSPSDGKPLDAAA